MKIKELFSDNIPPQRNQNFAIFVFRVRENFPPVRNYGRIKISRKSFGIIKALLHRCFF